MKTLLKLVLFINLINLFMVSACAQQPVTVIGRSVTLAKGQPIAKYNSNGPKDSWYFKVPFDASTITISVMSSNTTATSRAVQLIAYCTSDITARGIDNINSPTRYTTLLLNRFSTTASQSSTSLVDAQATAHLQTFSIIDNANPVTLTGNVTGCNQIAIWFNSNGATAPTDTFDMYAVFSNGSSTLYSDPCLNPNIPMLSVGLSLAAAGTAQIATTNGPVPNTPNFFVCSYQWVLSGTTPTVAIQSGQGATCAANSVTLTGAMNPASGTLMTWQGSLSKPVAATNIPITLCIILGGTTPTLNGFLTYKVN